MTLISRLSLFFIVALFAILTTFSITLFDLARSHLLRQVDERALSALDALAIAVEVEPDGLEWDSAERRLGFSRPDANGPASWGVFDEGAKLVDGSDGIAALPGDDRMLSDHPEHTPISILHHGERWRLAWRIFKSESDERGDDAIEPSSPAILYRKLFLAVAIPLEPAYATLQNLAICLASLTLVTSVWGAAASRWYCRRAVAPVTAMANAAGAISIADLSRRLPEQSGDDELGHLGRAFNDLLQRFQDSYERQRRFSGEASHQLRTPVTVLLGHVEVTLRREREPEEYRRVLHAVQRQSLHLQQIIESLLFLTRADDENAPLATALVDANNWLDEQLAARSKATHENLRVTHGASEPMFVHVHTVLLKQALDNLLENAITYSPIGSPIDVRTSREGDDVCIAIEDRGFGIPEQDQEFVFEPFFRSSDVRARGIAGTGLGLAIARRIISALGGRIDLRSLVGQGSGFTIRLPAVKRALPTE